MNNLDTVNSGEYKNYYQYSEKQLINKLLPKNVLKEIFSHLEDADFGKAASCTMVIRNQIRKNHLKAWFQIIISKFFKALMIFFFLFLLVFL